MSGGWQSGWLSMRPFEETWSYLINVNLNQPHDMNCRRGCIIPAASATPLQDLPPSPVSGTRCTCVA